MVEIRLLKTLCRALRRFARSLPFSVGCPAAPAPAKARPVSFRLAENAIGFAAGLIRRALPAAAGAVLGLILLSVSCPYAPLPRRRVRRTTSFAAPPIDFATDLIRRALPAAAGAVLGLILLSVSCPNAPAPAKARPAHYIFRTARDRLKEILRGSPLFSSIVSCYTNTIDRQRHNRLSACLFGCFRPFRLGGPAVWPRALMRYGRIAARQNRVFPCLSMIIPSNILER